jgi:dipeptidyl-peptidase-4
VKKDRKDKKAADSLEKKDLSISSMICKREKVSELKNYEKVKPKPAYVGIDSAR